MSDDRRRSAHYDAVRADRLRGWLASTVRPYSRPLGPLLERSGITSPRKATEAALRSLPVTPAADLGDGRRYVLEPTVDAFGRTAPIPLQARFLLADVFGRRDDFARRHIDPSYRPVLWTACPTRWGVLFSANTDQDLTRLAALGRRALAIAGVRSDDRVLLVDDGRGALAHWQFVLGCRSAGVAVLVTDPVPSPELMERVAPTVVAGPSAAMAGVLSEGVPRSVRLFVVAGEDPDDGIQLASAVGTPAAIWWAPSVTRAVWVRCPGGRGFHTWPEDELLEIVDGRLVWSAVGWHGSVWLRVDTGAVASLETEPCPSCGRTTPRVVAS